MRELWTHVGRLWTNGEPFLAVDAALRNAWHGFSNDEFDQVVGLAPQDTSIPVGTGRAVLVGADGVVRDDSWVEVFAAPDGRVAIVQASGADYPDVLTRALGYPDDEDDDGDVLKGRQLLRAVAPHSSTGQRPNDDLRGQSAPPAA